MLYLCRDMYGEELDSIIKQLLDGSIVYTNLFLETKKAYEKAYGNKVKNLFLNAKQKKEKARMENRIKEYREWMRIYEADHYRAYTYREMLRNEENNVG